MDRQRLPRDDRSRGVTPLHVVVSSFTEGERPIGSARHPVLGVPCAGSLLAYWSGLASVWSGPATIVNVEHDMQVDDALIDELLDCPEPLCTHAYQCYYVKPDRWYWAHLDLHDADTTTNVDRQFISEGTEYADFSAIGFCKITPEARALPLSAMWWEFLEHSVHHSTVGKWHMHWPGVAHGHDYGRARPSILGQHRLMSSNKVDLAERTA